MKEVEGRLYKKKGIIYIPQAIWVDSTFPFEEREKVRIKIEGKKLIIEKLTEK